MTDELPELSPYADSIEIAYYIKSVKHYVNILTSDITLLTVEMERLKAERDLWKAKYEAQVALDGREN